MGKVWSAYVKRPLINWNIENRAQRFIEKTHEKPKVAPRHPSSVDVIDKFTHEHPEIVEEIGNKDQKLADMLKGMVVNPDKMGEIVSKSTQQSKQRALPENRSRPVDTEFGYLEPEIVRAGRCTVRQALQFLGDHLKDPSSAGSPQSIASQYNLDVGRVQHVLKYFHIFNVQMPKSETVYDGSIALKPGLFRRQQTIESGATSDSKSDPTIIK